MIGVILTLAVVGVLLYLLETYVPMNAMLKKLIYVVAAICIVFWLINVFGLLAYDVPIPRFHR
jgi:predicted membrane channel-forming protein YqfA (hemolysin III family)